VLIERRNLMESSHFPALIEDPVYLCLRLARDLKRQADRDIGMSRRLAYLHYRQCEQHNVNCSHMSRLGLHRRRVKCWVIAALMRNACEVFMSYEMPWWPVSPHEIDEP
jgi:hypothetical protein